MQPVEAQHGMVVTSQPLAAQVGLQILKQGGFQGPSHHLPAGFLWRGVTGDLIFDSDGNRQVKLELLRGHANGFRAPHHGD